jgi:hypothetical protein
LIFEGFYFLKNPVSNDKSDRIRQNSGSLSTGPLAIREAPPYRHLSERTPIRGIFTQIATLKFAKDQILAAFAALQKNGRRYNSDAVGFARSGQFVTAESHSL